MRNHFFVVMFMGVVTGCGSSPANQPQERILATSDAGVIRDQDHIANPGITVPVSSDSVFKLMPSVFFELGMDANYSNRPAGQIGNRDFTKYSMLGRAPLHEYVVCGSTMTGAAADSYRVQMSVISTVTAEGSGSKIETALSARAADPGSSKGWVSCQTTGTLEGRMHRLLSRKIKG